MEITPEYEYGVVVTNPSNYLQIISYSNLTTFRNTTVDSTTYWHEDSAIISTHTNVELKWH